MPKKGYKQTEEHKRNASHLAWNKGVPATEEQLKCLSQMGTHHTEEWKQTQSISQTGKHPSPETLEKMRIVNLGPNNPQFGKTQSEETKNKRSASMMGKNIWMVGIMGEKSNSWKGGSKEYWGKQCKIRDDYTCQICGHREPEIMVADHILPKSTYPQFSCDINNLITLCPNCHARKTIREKKNKEYNKED